MKKKIIFKAILVTFLVAAVMLLYFIKSTCGFISYDSSLTVDEEKETLSFDGGSIKILQLSDVQTSNLIECMMAYPMVKDTVKLADPDLIVLTGDNISNGSSRAVLSTFIRLMDSFEIPWAPVFGNHDRNSDVSPDDIAKAYEESEYCIFKKGTHENRYGDYSYDILNEGKTIYSLFFMDSEKSNFTKEQVEWYKDEVLSTAEENGAVIPSFAFFHIPVPETLSALGEYDRDRTIGSGEYTEGDTSVQGTNTGFFDTALELGSTKALFFGHDHLSNTFINYKGILFCYATKTGKTVYFDEDMLGGNLITLYSDGSFNVERVNP